MLLNIEKYFACARNQLKKKKKEKDTSISTVVLY